MQIIHTAPGSFDHDSALQLKQIDSEITILLEKRKTIQITKENLDAESRVEDVQTTTFGPVWISRLSELCKRAVHETLIAVVKEHLTKMIAEIETEVALLTAKHAALEQKLMDEFKAGFAKQLDDIFTQQINFERDPVSFLHYSLVAGGLNVVVKLVGSNDDGEATPTVSLHFGPVETKQ